MEQGIFLTEQGIIFAEQGILAPEQGIGPRINFLTVRRYPTKFPLTQSMSSTGATADGFDRQFGTGRGGDAPRQLIGNVEALCQSIDPGRVYVGKSLRGRGSPQRFAEQVQCLHLPDVRPAYRLDRPSASYMEGTRAGNGSVQVPGVSELQPPGYKEHRHDRSTSRTRSRFP